MSQTVTGTGTTDHPSEKLRAPAPPHRRVVTRDEWIEARRALLAEEKAFTRARDALSAARRALPMVKVEKRYAFDAPEGPCTLADLFGGKRQLLVYHFMFAPGADEGCKGCSFVADHAQGALPHLAARDTAFVAVSRAPVAKLTAFARRMGWTFRWVSSGDGDFNYDYGVSFRPEDVAAEAVRYNYAPSSFTTRDAPGLSVFLRDGDAVHHTYSTYARGLDSLMTTYDYLDLTPLGRQEEGLAFPMAWLRHHDAYAER